MIIDAWIQHPTLRLSADPMFESLRRWNRQSVPTEELPVGATLAALDAAGVSRALACAWVGPQGALISNDEVARFAAESGGRLIGVGSVVFAHWVRQRRRDAVTVALIGRYAADEKIHVRHFQSVLFRAADAFGQTQQATAI